MIMKRWFLILALLLPALLWRWDSVTVTGGAELEEFDGSWEDFYRLWTRKESWCKREDAPLYPPREAVPPPGCCAGFAGEGWRGAVCCHGAPPEGVVWLSPGSLPEQGRA